MSQSPVQLLQYDSQGMLALTDRAADRAQSAYEQACLRAADVATEANGARSVLVCGMGGSAISGDLWHDTLATQGALPIVVWRSPVFPGWAGPETLVVLMSYSGDTAETLACAEAALAAHCRIVAISSGGALTQLLTAVGKPVVAVPGGLQPRAALPELFFSLLGATSAWPGMSVPAEQVNEAIASMQQVIDANGRHQGGPALALAERLVESMPFMMGISPYTGAVAKRWQTQFNENAKVTAHVASFPELTHNEIVNLAAADRVPFYQVVLDDATKPALLARQMAITLQVLTGRWAGETCLEGQGKGLLARQMSLVALGDYVSIYLAFLRRLDPTPVEAIRELKRRMQEQQ